MKKFSFHQDYPKRYIFRDQLRMKSVLPLPGQRQDLHQSSWQAQGRHGILDSSQPIPMDISSRITVLLKLNNIICFQLKVLKTLRTFSDKKKKKRNIIRMVKSLDLHTVWITKTNHYDKFSVRKNLSFMKNNH